MSFGIPIPASLQAAAPAVRRRILIIEDSPSLALTYEQRLAPLSHDVQVAGDGQTAMHFLSRENFDCLVLDLKLPDWDGMHILEEVRRRPAPPAVVVVTSDSSVPRAIQAVRAGAADYLVKPFSGEQLIAAVQNALSGVLAEATPPRVDGTAPPACGAFIGESPAMREVYRIIAAAAPSDASVFISGESGTGKELAAEALHRLSRRSARPFVALNCAAIPGELMESMVFGHVKGAFTGAIGEQEGAAGRADGGTLFLDEVSEMDPHLQAKLLRFLQTGRYERVGDPRPRQADIRFIAATNRDPEAAVQAGALRGDLFYRLHVIGLSLPPLRQRGGDIVLMARHFLAQYAAAEGRGFRALAPEVEAALLAHAWPGNVRQLQNMLRQAVVLHDGAVLTADMLPQLQPAPSAALAPGCQVAGAVEAILPLAEMERRYIAQVLEACGGNLHQAARRLGISPSTIYRKR